MAAASAEDLVLDETDLRPSVALEGDLVLEGDDLDGVEQPVFQSGGDASMVAKEADKETEVHSLEAKGRGSAGAAASREGEAPEGAGEPAADGRPVAKAVLVGDSGVGKTSLMMRFTQV